MQRFAYPAPPHPMPLKFDARFMQPEAVKSAVVERLPFIVKMVRTEQDMMKAVDIRYSAYARHLPDFAQTLLTPEFSDLEKGTAILLAESKLDGTPLGTMRIQTNHFKPLVLEQSVKLPAWLDGASLAEATRLGVTERKVGRLVKLVLFKAYYQYCINNHVDWMVVAGRAPIDRQYDQLMFEEIYPGMGYIPLQHASNIPHKILALNVMGAQDRWTQAQHPLLHFVIDTQHPDIDISGFPNPAPRKTAPMQTNPEDELAEMIG